MLGFIARALGGKPKTSVLEKALKDHVQEYFYSGHALSWIRPENKERLVGELFTQFSAIEASPDPRMTLRERLAEYVLLFAQLQMLCLTEDEKAEHIFKDSPYISGKIHHHIVQAAEHVEEAAQFVWGQDSKATAEELMNFANTRTAVMLFYANGLNLVRISAGDTDAAKDWFKPFVEAMVVWQEHVLRMELGLPALLSDPLEGFIYGTFLDYVLDGDANPFFSWTRAHPDLYLAGKGPLPELSAVQ
jgi:hypothetical protein